MVILLALCILFYLEASLEVVVIDLKNPSLPNYKELNDEEHRKSLIVASFIVGCVIALLVWMQSYYLIVPALISRRIFFDYTLIKLRNRPSDTYEGTGRVDTTLSNIFGKKGRRKELLAESIVFILFIALQFIL